MKVNKLFIKQFPIVSILIPAYNAELFLPQCLDSIINQTYTHLQVVIVDDGSIDKTLEIAIQYSQKYPFIEVFHQENSGVSSARNTLISHAKGDYVIFVDSDDWIDNDMVEQMINFLYYSNSDIVVCGYFKEKNNISIKYPIVKNSIVINGTDNTIKAFLEHKELNGSLWNKIVPREYYKNLTFNKDIWYGEDCLFFWQTLNQGVSRICIIPNCFYHYRINEKSISNESYNFKKQSGHLVWKIIFEDTKEKWPQFTEIAIVSFAISDFWQLVYAAKSNYPFNENLKCYQNNLRENIVLITKSGLINFKKKIIVLLIACNYKLSSYILRKILKFY